MVEHTCVRVRALRAGGAADVPPPDPALRARKGPEARVAQGGRAEQRRVALQVGAAIFI